jgi:hypothetical protein
LLRSILSGFAVPSSLDWNAVISRLNEKAKTNYPDSHLESEKISPGPIDATLPCSIPTFTAATPSVPGVPEIDVTHIAGQTATVATTPVDANVTKFGGNNCVFSSGRPEVNATHFGGSALTQSDGRPEVNVTRFGGANGAFSGGRPEVNVSHISGDSSAADRAEALFDVIVRDTIVSLNSQTGFSLQQGNETNDSYKGWLAVFTEGVNQSVRTVTGNNYDDPIFAYVVDSAPDFTISTATVVTLVPPSFAAADRTSLAAVKSKTDFMPSVTAGNNGGLPILDSNLNVQADIEAIDDDNSAPANAESFFDGNGFGVHPFRATIADTVSQTVFYMATGPETDNSLVGFSIIFRDPAAGEEGGPALSRRTITAYDYDSAVRTVTINSAPDFTINSGDVVEIVP